MKKLFALALAIFALSLFGGCGDPKGEEDGPDNASIIGKWQCVRETGRELLNGEVIDEWEDDISADQMFLTFFKGGKGISSSLGEDPQPFTYTLSGSTLSVAADGESMEYKVKTLTSKNLVLYVSERDGSGHEYEETLICVR